LGDIVIRETDDTIALRRKPGIAPFVTDVVDVVCCAVEFDDEFAFDASEVSNESADSMLAAELQSFEASVTECQPEELFGFRGSAAELTGVRVGVHWRMIL
jgi:hypothetical protein